MACNAISKCLLAISYGLCCYAWEQESDWLELGKGECRPKDCAGSCTHPWTERTTCVCSLDECMDFAVYNGSSPNVDGFKVMNGAGFSRTNRLDVKVLDGRRERYRYGFKLDEAAAECSSRADCSGFTCSTWSGLCYEFSSGTPVPCSSSNSSSTFPFGIQAGTADNRPFCWSGELSYRKSSNATGKPKAAFAGILFDATRWYGYSGYNAACSSLQNSACGYRSAQKCTVYDQQTGSAPVKAFGLQQGIGSNTAGTCWRPAAVVAQDEQSGVAISMTDANGQALDVIEMDTKVAMYGPFAIVQNHFKFRNPHSRTIEGRFRYILPPNAAVQRLAMVINGRWMEGEVVERKKANRIWRELLLVRRDPALLEQEQGNVYSMKIFPIRRNAEAEVILTYSVLAQMRDGVRSLTIPMVGLPHVSILKTSVVLSLGASENATVVRGPRGPLENATAGPGLQGWQQVTEGIPMSDIHIEVQGGVTEGVTSLKAGKYVVTWHALGQSIKSPSSRPQGGKWRFYIDTSASTGSTFVARQVMIEQFFGLLHDKTAAVSCSFWAFDLEVVEVASSTNCSAALEDGLALQIKDALSARLPLGLTQFDAALSHAASSADEFIVFITDGIATRGDRGVSLRNSLGALPATSKLWVLSIGTKLDSDVATAITGPAGGRVVSVPATANATIAQGRMSKVWDELLAPVGTNASVTPGSSAQSVYPKQFYDLRPGSEVVYVSWGDDNATTTLQIGNSTRNSETPSAVASTFAPLLEREGVRAELAMLNDELNLETDGSLRALIENRIVELSTTKRVLTSLTALLVLETEMDYVRFGIDRNARNNVLEISMDGVIVKRPSAPTIDYNAESLTMDADEPDKVPRQGKPSSSSKMTSSAPFRCLPSIVVAAPLLTLAYSPQVHDLHTVSLPGTKSSRVSDVLRVASKVGFAVSLVTLAGMLQGCFGEGYDDDGDWSPEWLNVTEWAIKYMSRTSEPTGRNRKSAAFWAEALAATGQASKLSAFSKSWLLWDPANGGVYENIGVSALALGDSSMALRAFTGLAEISSSNPAELLHSSWLCIKARQYSMAAELAQQAIQQREDNPNAYRALGIARYLQGDLEGAKKAYAAARWRPSTGDCVKLTGCTCVEPSSGEMQQNDQRATPHALLQELKYMEFHKGAGTSNLNVRLVEGYCEAQGCTDIGTVAECADAAAQLNIPLNGKRVYTTRDMCPSFTKPRCVLDEYGTVKLWDWSASKEYGGYNGVEYNWVVADSDRTTWKSPYICKCESGAVQEADTNVIVVSSWLGDGNDVDVHVKGPNLDVGPDEAGLSDVQQGLGPELIRTSVKGKLTLGVYYNSAAAMGAARGVLVVWDFKNKEPHIMPFALPAEEYKIISVAELDVTESDGVNVNSDNVLIR